MNELALTCFVIKLQKYFVSETRRAIQSSYKTSKINYLIIICQSNEYMKDRYLFGLYYMKNKITNTNLLSGLGIDRTI